MRGDRVAKMKQRLAREQKHQYGTRRDVSPQRKPPPVWLFLPGEARGVGRFRRGKIVRLVVRRCLVFGLDGSIVSLAGRWRRVERVGITQRYCRRSERGFVELGLVALRAWTRRQRQQARNSIEDRVAVAATHLAATHRQLLRGHAEDGFAAWTARELLVGHRLAPNPADPLVS